MCPWYACCIATIVLDFIWKISFECLCAWYVLALYFRNKKIYYNRVVRIKIKWNLFLMLNRLLHFQNWQRKIQHFLAFSLAMLISNNNNNKNKIILNFFKKTWINIFLLKIQLNQINYHKDILYLYLILKFETINKFKCNLKSKIYILIIC